MANETGKTDDEKKITEIEYGEFLDTWEPTDLLKHTIQNANLFDPVAQAQLLADVTGHGTIPRQIKGRGYNKISDEEALLRQLSFFEGNQKKWSIDFNQRLLDEGVREARLATFIDAMTNIWTDGKKRQEDIVMQRLKTGIYLHDRLFHANTAGKYVINGVDGSLDPLFDPIEVETLFRVNENMLELHLAEYIQSLHGDRDGSINWLHVRRGVCMPYLPKQYLEEAHYLSSYSLASGPAELFAQTHGRGTCNGIPCIFSGPVPAIQTRVIAFTPFIENMTVDQIEFVVAPPVKAMPLIPLDPLSNSTVLINDYEFV